MPPPNQHDRDTDVLTERVTRVEKPRNYRVLMHNDDYTPMDFVVMVLRDIYRKTMMEAVRLMLQVHNEGLAVAGVFTQQIAETKIEQTHALARSSGYPLLCTMEPEE